MSAICNAQVFPALREQMEPAGIQIIDGDLRWGVCVHFQIEELPVEVGTKRFYY